MTGIFRADDIRGKYGTELTELDARKIGYAISKYINNKKLILAWDNRLSTPSLKKALLSEINTSVIEIGMVPTPVFYYAMDHYKNDYGVMATASHLSKEFNGFKINHGSWALTYDTGINILEKFSKLFDYRKANPKITKINITDEYYNFILSKVSKLNKKLKVAVDGGNGVAGPFLVNALKMKGIKALELHTKPDGNFPYHVANPLINKNIEDLQKFVVKYKADVGIALDSDGDRIRVIGPKGEVYDNEIIIAMFAKHYLKIYPKSNVVYSSICSDLVKEVVIKSKGIPIMEKVGHSFMKGTAMKKKALIWGEYSGHFGFREINYNDDGIYAGLKLCELLSFNPKFWEEARDLSKLYIAPPELRIPIKESQKSVIMKKLFTKFKKYKITKEDGLRIHFSKQSWVLIRPSNTESMISLRFQAKNKAELKFLTTLIVKNFKISAKKS